MASTISRPYKANGSTDTVSVPRACLVTGQERLTSAFIRIALQAYQRVIQYAA